MERRRFLGGLAAAGLLAGCTSGRRDGKASATGSPSGGSSSPSSTTGPSGGPSATPALPQLPASVAWQPSASEIQPAVKLCAVRLLEAVAGWPIGGAGLAAARRRVAAAGYNPRLVDQVTPLLPPSPMATVRVVDAQYGGILSSSSSVLVVLQQWTVGSDGHSVVAGGTTVDVRLVKAAPQWRVTAVHPAAPAGPAPNLSSLASSLLGNPRLHLPVAARADLRSGTISAGVLSALRGLVGRHVIDVSVVKSGHPLYVFGTSRLSDHPRGHAVDVWAVDGRPVVAPANRVLVESVMRLGISLGAYQVGGPVDLDGSGSQYFSDNTHHDHIHLGFHA